MNIFPNTIVISDAAKFYFNLGKSEHPDGCTYEHRVVNHSHEFKNKQGDHNNNIESTWRTVREDLGLGRIKEKLDLHLCEALLRRHCRKNNIDPFSDLLNRIGE